MKYIIAIATNQRTQCAYYNNDGSHRLLPYQGEVDGNPSVESLRKLFVQICRERLSLDYSSQGSELNVCILFSGEVGPQVRTSIKKALVADHLGLVSTMDYEQMIACLYISSGKVDRWNRPLAVFLSVDNNDIVVQAISLPELVSLGTRRFQGFGKDKRMETAVEKIWEEASYQTCNTRETEEPFIRKAVNEFLQSGRFAQREWQLSDFRCQASLTQDLLKDLQKDQIQAFNHSLSLYVDNLKFTHNMCSVFLMGSTKDCYFSDGLSSFITPVVVEADDVRQIFDITLRVQELNILPIDLINLKEEESEKIHQPDDEKEEAIAVAPTTLGAQDVGKIGTSINLYEQSRKFKIRYELQDSGFFFKKTTKLKLTITIEGNKSLPCPCAVAFSTERFAVYSPEKSFIEELDNGAIGPFELGPYVLPLDGLKKSDTLYIQVWPVDKTISPNLFKNNRIEINI